MKNIINEKSQVLAFNKRLLATASFTITNINDGAPGEPGKPGEVKDFYDGYFSEGIQFWSSSYDNDVKPSTNRVKVIKSNDSKYGGNLLEMLEENGLYSKNKILVEKDKIYKFSFRVKQSVDPLNGSDKDRAKVYAGATTFDANGTKLSTNNGDYFITSATNISVSKGWQEYTVYMSTSTRPAIINGSNQTLCPAIKAFDTNTKAIKPMFIVNYLSGNGIALVDGLTFEDYTQEWNALYALKDKLNNDAQDVFDALTNNGKIQGMFVKDGKFIFNGEYINAKNLTVKDKQDNLTLGIDDSGNVTIRATSLNIGSKPVASKDDVTTEIDKVQISGRNLIYNSSWNYGITDKWSTSSGFSLLEPADDKPTSNIVIANVSGLTEDKYLQIWSKEVEVNCDGTKEFAYSFDFKTDNLSNITNGSNIACVRTFNQLGLSSAADAVYSYDVTVASLSSSNNNKWTRVTVKFKPTSGKYIRFGIYLSRNGKASWRELKGELGTKVTDWTPAPEDLNEQLDNKPNADKVIEAINNSNSEAVISFDKILLNGKVEFGHLNSDDGKLGSAFTQDGGKTLINGNKIVTGSVTAEKMDVYELLVKKRKNTGTIQQPIWQELDVPTFNISSEGNIAASGTFKSFDYVEGGNNGWKIGENGDSVFNNTLIRGRVELPNAGITDFGGKGESNIIANGSPTLITGWSWSGTKGVITLVDDLAGPYGKVIKATYSEVGTTGGTHKPPDIKLIVGKTYSWSVWVKANKTLSMSLGQEQGGQITTTITTEWQRYTHTYTATDTTYSSFTFYAKNTAINDAVYIHSLKLEEAKNPSEWSPYISDDVPIVRFWAGDSYEKRHYAPFRVLQDGSIFATEGTFGGTFTGNLKVGNIEIVDEVGTSTNPSYGLIKLKNDTNSETVIQIGENKSWFNSTVYFGDDDKAKLLIEPQTSSLDVKSGGSVNIKASSGTNALALKNTGSDAYALFGQDLRMSGYSNTLEINSLNNGPINLSIGNFADASSHDDVSMNIDGNLTIKNNFNMNGLRMAYVSGGVDFILTD